VLFPASCDLGNHYPASSNTETTIIEDDVNEMLRRAVGLPETGLTLAEKIHQGLDLEASQLSVQAEPGIVCRVSWLTA
jgi:hypothetical protein